ncbi:MAG: Cro/Cl family transcriptional regulator [Maricaulis sp.]|jgi:putative transcriptional regulator|nr:Cro/Cl family transcriptional regulator [Maricaulis sp.]HAQ35652.1 Cro/Cl family transcriptional regulator [Alphaproteobacteria bacterium]|tara:strand:- start:69 stop:311 length:243 start_codon:yes stop_codon:yes gene_type:complete
MPVTVTLDVLLAMRKRKAREVAEEIGLSETQLSLLRTGKVKGVRFETLAKLCYVLECSPADILGYERDADDLGVEDGAVS